MKCNILILGCGYVGQALAKHFYDIGHFVSVVKKRAEGLESLRAISHQQFFFNEDQLKNLIRQHDIFILTIAAKDRLNYETTYVRTAQAIKKAALTEAPKFLIYTSSTSVYSEKNGHWVYENSPLDLLTAESKHLIDAEQILLSLNEQQWKVCILRLSEIYGPGREIHQRLKKLQGQKLPGNGQKYSNMIHLDDIVRAIVHAKTSNLFGIYNLSDEDHPLRSILYDQVCKKYDLPSIEWNSSLSSLHGGNKRVCNDKIKETGYVFIHPNRIY